MRSLLYLLVLLAAPAQAQTLKDAVESAWRRSPAGATESLRQDEAKARADVAGSWLRASPSVSAGYKTDQIDRNVGAREVEIELGVPLALPGDRARAIAVGNAESNALRATLAAERLRLAGDVRDAYWTVHAARNERAQAQRRVDDLQSLADDVMRRVRVGDLARVDELQARSALLAAMSALRQSELDVVRAERAFAQLTGLTASPQAAVSEAGAGDTVDATSHPLLAQARAQAQAAVARARQAFEVRRDAPEVAVTLTRERGEFTAAYGHAIRVGVKMPLGSDDRNRVRIAETAAQRTGAEIELQRTEARLAAQLTDARDALAVARAALATAQERARLAEQAQALIGRAFTLGERDLAARLRADAERFEADLAAARAQLDVGRAVSRLNQAAGVIP